MPEEHGSLRKAIRIASIAIYGISALADVLLVIVLIARLAAGGVETALICGLAVVGLLLLALIWQIAAGMLNAALDRAEEFAQFHRDLRADGDRQARLLADVVDRLDGLTHWAAMSEATRSLLVRQREVDVFVKQIEGEIDEGRWAEADRLINRFQEHFGDTAGAEQLRHKLAAGRDTADDRVIRGRIGDIRRLMDESNFPAAEMALTKLSGDYPSDKRLDDLRSTFVRAQRRHRDGRQEKFHQLLAERKFEEAAPLLEEMTWLEADALAGHREEWKDAFRQAQHEARQAFTAAVKDKQWSRAAACGEQILSRFPDGSLAVEVRKLMETVRQRAASESAPAAEVPAQSQE